MYYNLFRKIATNLINSSSFLVPKASLKIIKCRTLSKYLRPRSRQGGDYNCKTRMVPSCLLQSVGYGSVPAPHRKGEDHSFLPGLSPVLCIIRYLDLKCHSWLIVPSSGHLSGPAHSSQLCSRSCPGGHSHNIIGLSGHRCLSEAPSSGSDPGLWNQADLGATVTLTKLLNLSKPQFPLL